MITDKKPIFFNELNNMFLFPISIFLDVIGNEIHGIDIEIII